MKKINLKVKRVDLQFFFIAIISMYYLYLVDISSGVRGISYENIAYMILLIWSLYWILRTRITRTKSVHTPWVIGMLGLILLSAIQSNILYGQSFFETISVQRRIIVYSISYQAIVKLLKTKKASVRSVLSALEIIGVIQLILCLLQYYVFNGKVILHVLVLSNSMRGTRYYFMPTLFVLLYFYELDMFSKGTGIKRIKSVLIIILIFLEIFTVQKFRMTSLGLISCFGLFVFLMRSRKQYKLLYFVIGAIAFGIIINLSFVQNIIDALLSGSDPYLATREKGRVWYYAAIAIHPLFGCGYPVENNILSFNASGAHLGILLNDNGIVGLTYMYGIVGLLWFISLWIHLLRRGFSIYKKTGMLMFFLFPLFFVITSISEIHWYWQFGYFAFIIFLSLSEVTYEEYISSNQDTHPKAL